MSSDQTGLFGTTRTRRTHRVAAHTRVTHDGTEVFVGEHERWSRGRQAPARGALRAPVGTEADGQLALFAPPAEAEPGGVEAEGRDAGSERCLDGAEVRLLGQILRGSRSSLRG